MGLVRHLPLVVASVTGEATFAEAARALSASGLPAIAVVEPSGHVRGVFTQDAHLRGLFPGYLAELRHTAFLPDDREGLAERARAVGVEPIARHATKAPRLRVDDSETHAAELFLHSGLGALPVEEDGRFVGMLDQRALCSAADARLVANAAPARDETGGAAQ